MFALYTFHENPLLNYTPTVIKVCGFASIVGNTAQLIGRLSNILVAVRTKDYIQRVDTSVNVKLPAESLYFVRVIYLHRYITLQVYQSILHYMYTNLYYVTCIPIRRFA
jgi:hypothetical protein